MISQKCPRCSSRRIRHGYSSTSILSKLICRYNLLCDNCNWSFVGFAVPGTGGKGTKRPITKIGKKPGPAKKRGIHSKDAKLNGKAAAI